MSAGRSSKSTRALAVRSDGDDDDVVSDDGETGPEESVLTENDNDLLKAVTSYGNSALNLVGVFRRILGANPKDWNHNNKSVRNIKPLVTDYWIDFIWRLNKDTAAGVLGCDVASVNDRLKVEMRIRTLSARDSKELLDLKNKIKKNVNNYLEKHVYQPARQLYQVAKNNFD